MIVSDLFFDPLYKHFPEGKENILVFEKYLERPLST
jgi:hypothetical protein